MAQAHRALNGDWQGSWLRATTAFEETNAELLSIPIERQPQRCRRRLAGTGRRPKNEEQRTTALGSKLQATKRRCLHFG